MPLNTEITRNGEIVSIPGGWNQIALDSFLTAALVDAAPSDFKVAKNDDGSDLTVLDILRDQYETPNGKFDRRIGFMMAPIYYLDLPCPLFKKGSQVLKHDYTYEQIDSDGNPLKIELKKGDKLSMWRSYR